MSSHGFTSAFATELDAYLAFKASIGFFGTSRMVPEKVRRLLQ